MPADAAEAAQEKKPTLPEKGFKVDGKSYLYKVAKFSIPGVGERTAKEALDDKEKYESLGGLTINEYLVCINSQIVEEE